MLTPIRPPGAHKSDRNTDQGSANQDTGLLLDCHERMRRFTALAAKLAEPVSASPSFLKDRAEAAAAVDRYFTVALPLHVADEEESIMPRLEAAPAGTDASREAILDLLASLRRQHREMHALLDELHPLWAAVARDPAAFAIAWPDGDRALGQGAARLAEMMHEHLALEEARFVPALACLPEDDRAAVAREIRARRM